MKELTDKKVIFKENPKRHADFKIRCEYEGISQSKFFRLMLRKMIEKDKRIVSLLDDWKEETKSTTKRRQDVLEQDRSDREEFEKEFGLSKNEIENLYDLFDA